MMPIAVRAQTDIGKEHHTNEDSFAIQNVGDDILLVVCDGMGGMGRGDEASTLGVDTILDVVNGATPDDPSERLIEAIQLADLAIRHALCVGLQGRPGCTAVSIMLRDGKGHVAWVGDSRVYLVRDGTIVQRTRDHKLVEDLVEAGELTPEEAKVSALSSVLTRALGGRKPDGKRLEVAVLDNPWEMQPGDWIVLCSDGLCDLVPDDELPELLEYSSPEEACKNLVQVALDRGGHDNITVICAEWQSPETLELVDCVDNRSHRTPVSDEAQARANAAIKGPAPDDSTDPFAPKRKEWPGDDAAAKTNTPAPPTPHFTGGGNERAAPAAAAPPAGPIFLGIALLGLLTWGVVNQLRSAASSNAAPSTTEEMAVKP